jgi:hypothetical protein
LRKECLYTSMAIRGCQRVRNFSRLKLSPWKSESWKKTIRSRVIGHLCGIRRMGTYQRRACGGWRRRGAAWQRRPARQTTPLRRTRHVPTRSAAPPPRCNNHATTTHLFVDKKPSIINLMALNSSSSPY